MNPKIRDFQGSRFDGWRVRPETVACILTPLSWLPFLDYPKMSTEIAAEPHNSMSGSWKIAEWVPRLVWDDRKNRRTLFFGTMPPLGKPRPRTIPEGALLHESVRQRMMAEPHYRPINLPTSYRFDEDSASP